MPLPDFANSRSATGWSRANDRQKPLFYPGQSAEAYWERTPYL